MTVDGSLWRARAEWWAGWSTRGLCRLVTSSPLLAWSVTAPTARGIGRLVMAWWRWVSVAERRQLTRQAGTVEGAQASAPEMRRADDSTAARWKATGAVTVAVILVLTGLAYRYGPLPVVAVALALLSVATYVGWEPAAHPDEPLPVSPLRLGEPVWRVKSTLVQVLDELGVPATLHGRATHWGWSFTCATGALIDDRTLRALERACQAPVGGIALLRDLDNAGAPELRVTMTDPLAAMPPLPDHASGGLSVHDPLPLGRSQSGQVFAESLLRTHVALIGGTGAGKTSGLNVLIDGLAATTDCVLWGVDLSHGPMLDSWGRVIQRSAKTPSDAATLLDDAADIMARRGDQLSTVAASDDPDDDDASDTWQPSRRGPQLVIVIDELALVAAFDGKGRDKTDLASRVEFIARAGRKYAVTLLLAGQRATGQDFGSTVLRAQVQTQLVMSCDPKDVAIVWGSRDDRGPGWNPEALDAGSPRDQGKLFCRSAAHRTPEVHRFHLLELPTVKRRRRQRLADGLPTLRDLAQPAQLDEDQPPTRSPGLVRLAADAYHDGEEVLGSADLAARLEVTEKRLGDAMAAAGVPTGGRFRPGPGEPRRRGYWRGDVRAAAGTDAGTGPGSGRVGSDAGTGRRGDPTRADQRGQVGRVE